MPGSGTHHSLHRGWEQGAGPGPELRARVRAHLAIAVIASLAGHDGWFLGWGGLRLGVAIFHISRTKLVAGFFSPLAP